MGEPESVLGAIYEDDDAVLEEETLDEDVEMLDAETLAGDNSGSQPPVRPVIAGDRGHEAAVEGGLPGRNQRRKASKKKNKKKRKGRPASIITDTNRFVIDTCRNLKEQKSYLVWSAVGCLGVSAVSDLVKEVYAIQDCGGQKTADGKRFRTGGGILWNILKTREPKAYKEIMTKGKEFEKQFEQPKTERMLNRSKEGYPHSTNPSRGGGEVIESTEQIPTPSDSSKGRTSVLDRIRVPVAYDDLFEEGEIND